MNFSQWPSSPPISFTSSNSEIDEFSLFIPNISLPDPIGTSFLRAIRDGDKGDPRRFARKRRSRDNQNKSYGFSFIANVSISIKLISNLNFFLFFGSQS